MWLTSWLNKDGRFLPNTLHICEYWHQISFRDLEFSRQAKWISQNVVEEWTGCSKWAWVNLLLWVHLIWTNKSESATYKPHKMVAVGYFILELFLIFILFWSMNLELGSVQHIIRPNGKITIINYDLIFIYLFSAPWYSTPVLRIKSVSQSVCPK